jgi:hypothetical protein
MARRPDCDPSDPIDPRRQPIAPDTTFRRTLRCIKSTPGKINVDFAAYSGRKAGGRPNRTFSIAISDA